MSKRKDAIFAYLNSEERKAYNSLEEKLKTYNRISAQRRKEDLKFWQTVNERESQVALHIAGRHQA